MADGPILLSESSDYSLSITLQSGSDDITMLIADDPDNYQFFYEPSHDIISGEVEAQDMDSEGLPVGLENELTTECTDDGDPTGTWRVILADLTGIKTASSTSDDGTSLLDVSWTITIEEDAAAPPCENEEEIITYLSENNINAQRSSSGLHYVIETPGAGAQPNANSNVTVAYKGYYTNKSVFDQSDSNGISFNLQQVIKGWTEGLQLMKEGAKYRFYIPSELAYGARGAGGQIGPNSTLIFDVELLSIK